jgi:hypothetical protein
MHCLKRHRNKISGFGPLLLTMAGREMKIEDDIADEKEADEVMFSRFSVGDLVQVIFDSLPWHPGFRIRVNDLCRVAMLMVYGTDAKFWR